MVARLARLKAYVVQQVKDMTIRQKLVAVIMATGTLALILAGSVFVAYQYMDSKRTLVRALQTQAAMIATNCRAAVQFQDPKDAAGLLEAFSAQPSVLYAWILTNNQQVLARYVKPGAPPDAPLVVGPYDPNGYAFWRDLVVVSKPVVLEGEALGTVRVCSNLEPVKRMFRRNLATVISVLGLALLAAYLISFKLQNIISRPILELADVARTVSEQQQYSVRATKRANDEIGLLIDTFNQMLGQIQVRDQALVEANEQLEERVRQRTEELRKANEQLKVEMDQRQRAELAMRQRAERVIKHQAALLRLQQIRQTDLQAAFNAITEDVARTLDVERVGIWLFDESGQSLICQDQYTLSNGQHTSSDVLATKDCPRYIQALEASRILAADDASKDQRTSEFAKGYLDKHGIVSMMDVPLRLHGRLVGVVCHEHNQARQWTFEEQDFAASVADTIVLRLETAERQKAEQALRESEHRYRTLLKNIPQKIFYKDMDCVYLLCNESYAADLKLASPDQIRGKTDYDFFPYELAEKYRQDDRRVMQSGVAEEIEDLYVCDGRQYIIQTVKCPVRDEDGRIVGLLGIFWDITARKQAEHALEQLNKDLQLTIKELERSNRELQDFAYVTAHDLKAPLRAVGTLSDWLYNDYHDRLDDQAKDYLQRIKGRVKRMNDLIDSILRYSEIGRGTRRLEPVDLASLVPEVIAQINPPANIKITIEGRLPTVMAEKIRVVQVFQNLINNAVKFMDKPEGRIRIGCKDEGQAWRFFVSDNGPGIDRRYHEKIFKIFQTLTPRDELDSAGIGLAVVKKVVELYGGKVWVESELGAGSTFFFTLPKQVESQNEVLKEAAV